MEIDAISVEQLVPGCLVTTISIDLADGGVGWCPARLHDHDATTAVLTMRRSARRITQARWSGS